MLQNANLVLQKRESRATKQESRVTKRESRVIKTRVSCYKTFTVKSLLIHLKSIGLKNKVVELSKFRPRFSGQHD